MRDLSQRRDDVPRWLPPVPQPEHVRRRISKPRIDVTVCVAGLCVVDEEDKHQGIVIASDQQITDPRLGEEHEPPQAKNIQLSRRVLALVSGDMGQALLACRHATATLRDSPTEDVGEIAARLGLCVVHGYRTAFQRAYLDRYGATIDSMNDGTAAMPKAKLRELQKFFATYFLDCHFIVAGVDRTGAHLWYVDGTGEPTVADPWGCAAIGSGEDYALRHLKRVGYNRQWITPWALFAVYSAKKQAEMSQGVGAKRTTVVAITQHGMRLAHQEIEAPLREAYKNYEDLCRIAFETECKVTQNTAFNLTAKEPLWQLEQAWQAEQKLMQLPQSDQTEAPQSPPESTHDQ